MTPTGLALRDLLRGLRKEPLRAALTLLGTIVGSAAVVFLSCTLASASYALSRAAQEASGANILKIVPAAATGGHGARGDISRAEARALRESEPGARVAPSAKLSRRSARALGRSEEVTVQGGGAAYAELVGLEVLHGRALAPQDEGERRCVLGSATFVSLFDGQWSGSDARLVLDDGVVLQVVGVFAPRPALLGGGSGASLDASIWVPERTFRDVIAGRDGYEEVAMQLAPGAKPDEAALRVATRFESLRGGSHDFAVVASSDAARLAELVPAILSAILLACSTIALGVGAVNVMAAQLVSLHERARELAVRRAIGLSARALRSMVLVQSVTMTLLGGAVGVACGLGAAFVAVRTVSALVLPVPFLPSAVPVVVVLVTCVAAGALAAWLPARRASSLSVTECLRG